MKRASVIALAIGIAAVFAVCWFAGAVTRAFRREDYGP